MFFGEQPEVIHLNIFGFLVYIHIPKEKRIKLDPSGKKGFFIAYSEQSKAYRIYIPRYRQIELSRDVTFDEDTTSRKSNNDKEDEEFERFKEFKALVENIFEKKIKILRSDNGGEFTSNEFNDFCKEVGIKRELTIPYNPQQNGVAEGKNRSIMEVVKAMIHDQDLPMYLWEEVATTTVYVHNRISHSALGNKTPEKMFSGERPEVSHLKIFGCPVYIHIPKEKRSKLDPSGKKGLFVGYSEQSKAYRIYIPRYHKIEISRDVTFDEDSTFRKSRKYKEDEEEDEIPKNIKIPNEVSVEEEDPIPEEHDMTEPQLPEYLPNKLISQKRKLS